MKIRVLAVGKTRERFVREGLDHYLGRLRPPWAVDWVEIKAEKGGDDSRARSREADRILGRIDPVDGVALLDEGGEELSSRGFAAFLAERARSGSTRLAFVIGGAYGVSPEVASRAGFTVSLSRMTLPHQLVRLVLAEQIYRGVSILEGAPYHHG